MASRKAASLSPRVGHGDRVQVAERLGLRRHGQQGEGQHARARRAIVAGGRGRGVRSRYNSTLPAGRARRTRPDPAMTERPSLTYRDAGVDIDAGEELVERIKPRVARTHAAGGAGRHRRLRRHDRDPRGPLAAAGAGRRHRRRRHQAPARDRHRPARRRRPGPRRHVRERRRGPGRGAPLLPRLLRDRAPVGGRRRARHRRHRRGLRAGGLRAGRRRDRRDARHVRRGRLRPRGLLRRRRRARPHHRRAAHARRRRRHRARLVRARTRTASR